MADFYAYKILRHPDNRVFARMLSNANQKGWAVIASGHSFTNTEGGMAHWAHMRRPDVYKRKNAEDQRVLADRRESKKEWDSSDPGEKRQKRRRKVRRRWSETDVGRLPAPEFNPVLLTAGEKALADKATEIILQREPPQKRNP